MSLGLLLAILFTIGWIPLYFARTEAIGQALPHYEPGERLTTLLTAVALSLHSGLGCIALSSEPAIPLARALLAGAAYLFGLTFWFWGRSLIGPLTARRVPDEPPLQFKRNGAFGIVRHPLYFGYLMVSAAPVLGTFNSGLAVSYLICAGLLGLRAVQEERRLRAQLGAQYEAYSRRVKRLIPFVW